MKLIITLLFLTISVNKIEAQYYNCCKDTTHPPDKNFACNAPDYTPVCGCDGVTYRNICAAVNWGGLTDNGTCPSSWVDGICGNFDFDFNPTGIQRDPVNFYLYMKSPGSATLYIYGQYGNLYFSDYFTATYPDQILQRQLNFQSLEIGIYFAVVVVNGEKQTKKFGKVIKTTQ